MNIRQANLGDVETLVQLRMALLYEVGHLQNEADTAVVAEATRRYLTEKIPTGKFVAWVAEVDGNLVGTSGMVFLERPPDNGNLSGLEVYVMNIYTVPAWRGKGIATALLRQIISFVKERDAKRIWLRATEEGKRVYEKFGFVSTGNELELSW